MRKRRGGPLLAGLAVLGTVDAATQPSNATAFLTLSIPLHVASAPSRAAGSIDAD